MLWIVGCGGGASKPDTAAPSPTRTLPLADVYRLGESGPTPADTVATLTAGIERHILLRTAPPDDATIADVYFGSQAFQAPAGTVAHVTLRPTPGTYGLVIETDTPFQAGAILTFKYALHFLAPPEATLKYPSHVLFERALAIGRIGNAADITLLPSVRPAADNLEAPAATPGTYLVAAPK